MNAGVGPGLNDSQFDAEARRPLLVRGETLKLDITRKSSFRPKKWPTSLQDAATRVIAQSSAAAAALEATPQRYLGQDTILEIVLYDYALAPSAYPARLFQDCGFIHVGSAVRNNARTVYVAIPDDGLQALIRTARNAETAIKEVQEGIHAVDTVAVAHGTARDQPTPAQDDDRLVELVLHGQRGPAGQPMAAGNDTIDSVRALVAASGGSVEDRWIRRSDTTTFVPARIGTEGLAEIVRHNTVRIGQSMPQLRRLPEQIPLDELPLTFSVPGAGQDHTVPPLKVAVFDGGVDADSPVWQGQVDSYEIGAPAPNVHSLAHGALVTSSMLYGHLTGNALPPPANLKITHYAAIPQYGHEQDLQMYWLLDTMAQIIRSNDYDVVLICIGPDLIVTDDHIDRWTSTIDQLSFEEDVLFVVAAGNNGELDPAAKMNRLLVPGDTVNGIAVGATGNPSGTSRAPYSATGPGRTPAQILPTGIAFGGSVEEPFIAVDNDGARLQFQGTSCAAPQVVHGLARAATRLGLHYRTATVLRCSAIHFADKLRGQQPDDVGYGHLPLDYPEIEYNKAHVVHVMYQGETTRGELETLVIPMPEGMPGPVRLRLTLVSTSEVNSSDAGDYVGAGLDVKFRPDADVFEFSPPQEGPDAARSKVTVNTRREPQRAAGLLEAGWTQAAHPKTQKWTVETKPEVILRAGGKWESVRVIDHKSNNAPVRPRIELRHLSRKRAVLTQGTPPLKWTMLVTLECPEGTELYQAVRAQFPTLLPHIATIEPEAGTEIDTDQ